MRLLGIRSCLALIVCGAMLPAVAAPDKVRVVVVSMFERGAIEGDEPGEFQHWLERYPLTRQWDFPAGPYPLRGDGEGVLAICVGGGVINAAASIMALGYDPRFDVSEAYWVVAGIAGGDPHDASLGSAFWARHVVDGDLLYEIDAREIPSDWPYGLIPLGTKRPAASPRDLAGSWSLDSMHFALNEELTRWAFDLSRGVVLEDTEAMASFRAQFRSHEAARRPPFIGIGDTLSASTYWHGAELNRWANDWVALYAGADANFVTTNMEDSGTLTAIERLSRVGRADRERVLVLRTVSNYSMPPRDRAATWSVTAPYPDRGLPAIDAAYRVAEPVVRALAAGRGPESVGRGPGSGGRVK